MQKVWKIAFVLSIITNLILGFIVLSNLRNKEVDSNAYISKIDSLELELFTIQGKKDSIRNSIDTIIIEIGNNKKDYEKIRDIIASNTTNEDYLFFTKYIIRNRQRLDSINNF